MSGKATLLRILEFQNVCRALQSSRTTNYYNLHILKYSAKNIYIYIYTCIFREEIVAKEHIFIKHTLTDTKSILTVDN